MYVFFAFTIHEVTTVLPIRQFFDLIKLCNWNEIRTLHHLVKKLILNHSEKEAMPLTH